LLPLSPESSSPLVAVASPLRLASIGQQAYSHCPYPPTSAVIEGHPMRFSTSHDPRSSAVQCGFVRLAFRASHARGRWFETSRAHRLNGRLRRAFRDSGARRSREREDVQSRSAHFFPASASVGSTQRLTTNGPIRAISRQQCPAPASASTGKSLRNTSPMPDSHVGEPVRVAADAPS
jgi:hypothetical protein